MADTQKNEELNTPQTREQRRAVNLAKMGEAEKDLLASGFSPEQWKHVKTYLAYSIAEVLSGAEDIRQGRL